MAQGNFTVYRSSAGSGKTYTLVLEYLRMVLKEPARFRNVLAITFTNKAAAEMKERVLRYLRELCAADEANATSREQLIANLVKTTGLSATDIPLRAAHVLELILHQYSDFAITTIDSFMHRVIRTFTFDLKLPSGFEVELETGKLVRQAVDLLVSRAGNDELLTRVLMEFSESRAEDDKSYNLEDSIAKLAMTVTEMEESSLYLEGLEKLSLHDLLDTRKRMMEKRKAFEKEIVALATIGVASLTSHGVNTSDLYKGASGIGAWFVSLSEGKIDKVIPNASVLVPIEEDRWTSSKCTKETAARIEEIKGTLLRQFELIRALSEASYQEYKTFGRICDHFYPLMLINEISRILSDIQQRDNLVMISEFNRIIASVVMEEPVPFIYERLGVKYQHFLFDEFQDTSILQWRNLMPLLENGLSEGKFSMLVGDGKQAIYRWRNGEVEQFSSLPHIYKRPGSQVYIDRENTLIRNYKGENLAYNYRSLPEIIAFNNRLYRYVAGTLAERGKKIYEGLEQEPGHKRSGGYVGIEFPDQPWDEFNWESHILELIASARAAGYSYSDIGILHRGNKAASELASFILMQGIPVVSAESLLLDGYPSVQFLLSSITFLTDPEELLARASMLRFLSYRGDYRGMSLEEVFRKAGMLKAKTDAKASREDFAQLLADGGYLLQSDKLLKMPLYDLCEELIRIFHLGTVADPYLQFFLDSVLVYTSRQDTGSAGFLTWWEENKAKRCIVVPGGTDAVNIMTIHKSKGLEFPVVILPATDSTGKNTLGKVWVPFEHEEFKDFHAALISNKSDLMGSEYEDLYVEENEKSRIDFVNLLYVATTRASERLHILCGQPSKETANVKSVTDILVEFLKLEGKWTEGNFVYEYGTLVQRSSGEKSGPSHRIAPKTLVSQSWQERILMRLQAPGHWDVTDPDHAREWGMLIHTLLAGVSTREDIRRKLDELRSQGIVADKYRDRIEAVLEKILKHPDLVALFDEAGRVVNEAEILTASGDAYRPDRVTIGENGVTVIDYKTGKPMPGHSEQLRHYMHLLGELGYDKVNGYLVYIGQDLTVEAV